MNWKISSSAMIELREKLDNVNETGGLTHLSDYELDLVKDNFPRLWHAYMALENAEMVFIDLCRLASKGDL